jgi:hypothetical protein
MGIRVVPVWRARGFRYLFLITAMPASRSLGSIVTGTKRPPSYPAAMVTASRSRVLVLLFLILCTAGPVVRAWQVRDWGNELSLVDAYSEANALREVRNFLEHGLTRNHGLGNVYHEGMYPTEGLAADPMARQRGVSDEGVYTHYPPGPEYLLYADAKLLGMEPVSHLRWLPIAAGLAALIFFGLAVRHRFGPLVGWVVMSACVINPAVTDGFVGLHYQGWAFALLLVELGLLIRGGASAWPFALLGFSQGWLSFDYFFLVSVTPLALELVMPRIDPGHEPRWRLAWTQALIAGAGFAAAHGLHFLQVRAYLGSFDAAVRDLSGAATERSGGGSIGYLPQALGNLKTYFYGIHPLHAALTVPNGDSLEDWAMFRFLGLSLGPWWLLVTAALMVWERIDPRANIRAMRLDWHFVTATGMVTSSLWLVAMVNHGGYHRHFLFRHLFFAFFVMVLFGAVRLCKRRSTVRLKAVLAS